MIGLGVGIDYALLIVTRYREQLHAGHTVRESIAIAIDTAGRSVLFAGITVVISLLGMLLMGVSFVQGLAVGAASVVAVTVRRVAHAAARAARLRRRRASSCTRWRGLIAAGLVADRARRRRPRRSRRSPIGLPLARRSCSSPASSSSRSSGRCRAGRRSRCARPPPTGGAASSSTARGPPRSRGTRRAAHPGHPGARPAARLLRREQLRRGHHHQAGLRPARRRLRRGLQRPAAARRRAARRAPTSTTLDADRRGRRRRPGRRVRVARRVRTTPTTRPRCSGTSCPTTGPQDEATTELVDRLRDDVLPPAEAGRRRRGRRHRHGRRQRRLLRLPRRRGCRTSSAPCWRCRSCC